MGDDISQLILERVISLTEEFLPDFVTMTSVTMEDSSDDNILVKITYLDRRFGLQEFGAEWHIDLEEMSLELTSTELCDHISTYVLVFLEELIWAGGDPRMRPVRADGIRWHIGTIE